MSTSTPTTARIDHEVTKTWVRCLLVEALRENQLHSRIGTFEAGSDPLAAFASYLDTARPVVLIETATPYAERAIAELIEESGRFRATQALPELLSGLAPRTFGFPPQRTLMVLSVHEPPGLSAVLPIVHEIESTDNAVLIGCARKQQLPAELLRIVDAQLRLPSGGAGAVRGAFETLFGKPSADWQALESEGWLGYTVAADLQPPRRMSYETDRALEFVRERVQSHLRRLSTEDAPALSELHGLGAARDVAVDLIGDMRLALDGAITWDEVDRGMLLVGPPGTGKTTLARAIAKECGLKFIAASASAWQAVESLGEHLAAIRATFAEARRFQPAILFIDELDSVGNRERFTDRERTYQTAVVNLLLEELDGYEGRERIVVIAATNDAGAVDPALRRAGRLDQVVEVPYPNVAALSKIYQYYLEEYREAGRLADDLNHDELARLSFGVTGADVEFFVRGAARRARKRSASIRQADLVAEILRRPRELSSVTPLDEATVHRLAVHEAGHALMRLLGSARGEDIAYVSISPRSDGRIGYTAALHEERVSTDRGRMEEQIGVQLAGRAAEDVMFGPHGVSDLAGKYGADGDLGRASRLAERMLGMSGLGRDGDLVWWGVMPAAVEKDLEQRVQRLLAEIYARTVERLRAERELLGAITQRLVAQQELTGEELRALGA